MCKDLKKMGEQPEMAYFKYTTAEKRLAHCRKLKYLDIFLDHNTLKHKVNGK